MSMGDFSLTYIMRLHARLDCWLLLLAICPVKLCKSIFLSNADSGKGTHNFKKPSSGQIKVKSQINYGKRVHLKNYIACKCTISFHDYSQLFKQRISRTTWKNVFPMYSDFFLTFSIFQFCLNLKKQNSCSENYLELRIVYSKWNFGKNSVPFHIACGKVIASVRLYCCLYTYLG